MKKILFNDKFLLTQAVLAGRKTQTRRIVSQSLIDKYEEWYDDVCSIAMPSGSTIETLRDWLLRKHTRYRVGEMVAVAQRMCDIYAEWDVTYLGKDTKALMEKFGGSSCFNNKMFVKASEMPHQIRITNVRIEKLQDISEQDAIAEGITYVGLTHDDYGEPMFVIDGCKEIFSSARDAYACLIDKISGKGTWTSNPYVFVYDFKLMKTASR